MSERGVIDIEIRLLVEAIYLRWGHDFRDYSTASLRRRVEHARQQMGLPSRSPDGLSTREQLDLIAERSADLVARHARCFVHDVLPALAAKGVQIVSWADLAAGERDRMRDYFRDQVFPVLTPLAVDPAHPFPYISGLSLNLAVVVRDPDGGPELFARVKVPNNVPRLVRVSAGDARGVGSVAASGETRAAGTVGSVGEPRTAGTAAPRGIRFLPLEELKRNRFILPARGRGIFSPVYIDNLVDGIVAAAQSPAAAGGVFSLTDGVGVTTHEFFQHYAVLLGKRLPTLPTGAAVRLASLASLAARGHTEVNPSAARYLARSGTYSITRARRVFSYAPSVPLAEGMERTAAWLRTQHLV